MCISSVAAVYDSPAVNCMDNVLLLCTVLRHNLHTALTHRGLGLPIHTKCIVNQLEMSVFWDEDYQMHLTLCEVSPPRHTRATPCSRAVWGPIALAFNVSFKNYSLY